MLRRWYLGDLCKDTETQLPIAICTTTQLRSKDAEIFNFPPAAKSLDSFCAINVVQYIAFRR